MRSRSQFYIIENERTVIPGWKLSRCNGTRIMLKKSVHEPDVQKGRPPVLGYNIESTGERCQDKGIINVDAPIVVDPGSYLVVWQNGSSWAMTADQYREMFVPLKGDGELARPPVIEDALCQPIVLHPLLQQEAYDSIDRLGSLKASIERIRETLPTLEYGMKVMFSDAVRMDFMNVLDKTGEFNIVYYRVDKDKSRGIVDHGFWLITSKDSSYKQLASRPQNN